MDSGHAPSRTTPCARRYRGPSGVGHTLVVLCAWALAGLVTLAVAAKTKIGPVVVELTRSHGVHAGDVLAAVVMSLFAMTVTVLVIAHFWAARRRARRAHRYAAVGYGTLRCDARAHGRQQGPARAHDHDGHDRSRYAYRR
ncbi:hypothetical protein SAMN05443637_12472 [Pseudonocardia thermophila]|jgi:hypothetical protein|uniref:Uncharacterized protein n=1 Tax=Pseudonocardia thermophila TaxID=1848 RepID=A0A1M6ZN99_PSETH|nr:hypothetical protein [Pseudonocardia thermophila]SHL31900.1 hypothetical protein SAMN05443637_12472 [Pseudonocardia thermophila]